MTDTSTITSSSLDRKAEPSPTARPQLVMIATTDELAEPSSRHLLDDIDEVRFGRGPRGSQRTIANARRVLELRFPDGRMSTDHGRLLHGPSGWVLDDPTSKNGAVIDGVVTRRAAIGDRTVFELGHTFFILRTSTVEDGAAPDVDDDELRAPAPALATFEGALAEQFASLARIAPSDVSVLLEGETGTGKEMIAQAVHAMSERPGAFIAVNCGALPESLVEAELFGYRKGAFTGAIGERLGFVRSADRGTLLLDEVGELPPLSQAAFLRVLQEREVIPVGGDKPIKVDVRLCAATLRDLEALVETGAFRRDLYARLYGFTLVLPALRERIVDLGMLTRRLLAAIPNGASVRLAPASMRAMVAYDWPLNIRELEKVLGTAVALAPSGMIELAHLPESVRAPRKERAATADPAEPVEDDGLRGRLVQLLTAHRGNVVAVAKDMGTRRTQVYRWIHRFGIEVAKFRA